MTRPEKNPDAPPDADAGHLTALMLAEMLNKNPLMCSCDIHGDQDVQVGLLYTVRNLELIITKCCCDVLKKEIEPAIKKIQEGLREYFLGSIIERPKTKKKYLSDERMLQCMELLMRTSAIETAKEFADEIGLKKQNLVRIKNNVSHFTPEHIQRACAKYKINANWIFGFESNMFLAQRPVKQK